MRLFVLLALSTLTWGASLSPARAAAPDWKPAGYQQLQQAYENKALIQRFYSAFARGDAKTMASCYHPQASFYDPVFEDLKGPEISAMWFMLTQATRGSDFRVTFRDIQADTQRGRAHWEAWYDFSATGNRVHNIIDAEFEFKDGLIYQHRDRFDLHRWSGMALGPMGTVLGGTPIVQNQIRKLAQERLKSFMAENAWVQSP